MTYKKIKSYGDEEVIQIFSTYLDACESCAMALPLTSSVSTVVNSLECTRSNSAAVWGLGQMSAVLSCSLASCLQSA